MKDKRESASMGPLPDVPAIDVRANAHGFEVFLRSQFRGLLQFLRARTASEQDAEDAAQESMAKLLRYRESEPPSAWKQLLYRIAVNVAHDQYRVALSHHSKDHVALDSLEIAAGEHNPEQRALYDQQVARLTRAIMELPPKCQRVYLLKRVHGLSHAQIAERCGISMKMVEKHLATALTQLRRKVGDSSTETL
ncbi:RNA polymerase sigma factor [Dyella acidisoli]|uniref:DNA-directed RNA polymerase sigma-70 factor n=1 Tax=Dyella acidisoli TaxID=1867834 RepID=A0ABQ5XID7_9GAMM|nr:RNA polymerase sigma factor [Dyella acidisoli]GLQ91465.1 DNA-directed RNA polymerase sigma-70 factor [Dyella acidisoli]